MFLERAQPERYGDPRQKRMSHSDHRDDELIDGTLENAVRYSVQEMLDGYKEKVKLTVIEEKMPKRTSKKSPDLINYRKSIAMLDRVGANDRVLAVRIGRHRVVKRINSQAGVGP